jgi:hypothetical protein
MGRSRGGLTGKIHAVVDRTGCLSVWDSQRANGASRVKRSSARACSSAEPK